MKTRTKMKLKFKINEEIIECRVTNPKTQEFFDPFLHLYGKRRYRVPVDLTIDIGSKKDNMTFFISSLVENQTISQINPQQSDHAEPDIVRVIEDGEPKEYRRKKPSRLRRFFNGLRKK